MLKVLLRVARRVPSLELDPDVVKAQVQTFKATEAEILKALSTVGGEKPSDATEESPVAKLLEEMKALPSRVAERLGDVGEPFRRRKMKRFHPMMFEELMHFSSPGDPSSDSHGG